jgi:hypothetical protein
LTSEPLVLRSDYAQSYHPCHHNFCEEFIFDPHLEPELDPRLRAELVAASLRGIYASYADNTATLWMWTLDDKLLRL